LEKLKFAEAVKIGARFGEIGARFSGAELTLSFVRIGARSGKIGARFCAELEK